MSKEIITKIEKNWDLFYRLVQKIENDKTMTSLITLCDEQKDKFAAAPASTRTDFTGAYPGGLVRHCLAVFSIAKNLNKTFGFKEEMDSLIVTALFHDFGKIGSEDQDYYLEQKSSWHRDRGMMYELNKDLNKAHPSQRSLWWLMSKAQCPLKEKEIIAISSLANMGHMYSSELYDAHPLTVILQTAVRVACIRGKNKESVIE